MSRHDAARMQTVTQRSDVCQICGGGRAPVVYGKPTADAWQAAADGVLVLAGRMKTDNHEYWSCPSGHRWPADEVEWAEAVRAALWGRPLCPRCGGPSLDLVYPGDPNLDVHTEDLARGFAVMAPADPDPGEEWVDRLCQKCGNQWSS